VVFTLDGYDEISLTSDTRIFAHDRDELFHPRQINLKQLRQMDVYGGKSPKEAAQIIRAILGGRGSKEQRSVVASNTAHAIQIMDNEKPLIEIYRNVEDFLRTGKAEEYLNDFLNQD
jgi:anthranilate phosphoribosyltransferase